MSLGTSPILTLFVGDDGASWIEKNALLYDTFTTDDGVEDEYTFEADTIGNAPSGWEYVSGKENVFTVESDGSGGKLLRGDCGEAASSWVINSGGETHTDVVVTGKLVRTFLTAQCRIGVRHRGAAEQDGYSFLVEGSNIYLQKHDHGAYTQLDTAVLATAEDTWYDFKIEAVGTTIRAKVWTGAEPGTWDVEAIDAAIASGKTTVSIGGPTLAEGSFDDITIKRALTSPRTCEPGPGLLVVTDAENKLSLSGGNLVCTGGKTVPAFGDPGAWLGRDNAGSPAAQTMAAGYGAWFTAKTLVAGKSAVFGFDSNTAGSIPQPYAELASNNTLRVDPGNTTPQTWTAGTTKTLLQVLRSDNYGSFFIDGGKLFNVNNDAIPAASGYVAISNYNATLNVSDLALLPLATYNSAWGGDWSEVTDTKTNPANASEFSCEADFEMSYTFTVEDGNSSYCIARAKTASDYGLSFGVLSDRRPIIVTRPAGVINNLWVGSALTDGVSYKFTLTASGSTVKAYIDNVLVASETAAGNQTTASGLVVTNLATNDIVLTTHPYPALGIADSRVVCPQDDDTFTHSADFVAEIKNVQLPAADDLSFQFRISGSDELTLNINDDGSIALLDNATSRISAGAGTVSSDDDVVLVCDGANGEIFVAGSSAGTTSAIAHLTGTSGKRDDSTTGTCDHIACFPSDVSSLLPEGTF